MPLIILALDLNPNGNEPMYRPIGSWPTITFFVPFFPVCFMPNGYVVCGKPGTFWKKKSQRPG